jgi:phage gp46-like protein
MPSTIFVSDMAVVNQHLEVGTELRTPIMLSLLSWALAQDGDNVVEDGERYGWWGDTYSDVPGDHFGSRIWTMEGQPIPRALAAIPALGDEALQWMIDDGVVTSIQTSCRLVEDRTIEILVSGKPANGFSDTFVESFQLVLS